MISVLHRRSLTRSKEVPSEEDISFDFEATFSRPADREVIERSLDSGLYEMVAEVHCDGPENAYHLTQNIDSSWADSGRVTVHQEYAPERGLRSSMVGDIFFEGDDAFVCAAVGFEKLDDDLTRRIRDTLLHKHSGGMHP